MFHFISRDTNIAYDLQMALEREHKGPSYTALLDNEVIGCAGIMIPWPGVGVAWVAFSKKIESYKIWMHKMVQGVLYDSIVAFKLHRIEAVVLSGQVKNERWLESLGFKREDGRARCYTPDGHDVIRYELLAEVGK